MDAWDALLARRDVRDFSNEPIPDDDLDRILEAGRRSPSAMNAQPWEFVVCKSKQTLERLAEAAGSARHVAESAASIALVMPERDTEDARRWLHYDLGQVTMAMMIAATSMGIGSSHAAVRDESSVRTLLGIPPGFSCLYLVALGYQSQGELRPIANPKRRPLEDITHYEKW